MVRLYLSIRTVASIFYLSQLKFHLPQGGWHCFMLSPESFSVHRFVVKKLFCQKPKGNPSLRTDTGGLQRDSPYSRFLDDRCINPNQLNSYFYIFKILIVYSI